MAIVAIDLGTSPTGTGGDNLRAALTKVNTSISELDGRIGGEGLTTDLVGGAAYLDVGTTAGTVAAGDDSRFTSLDLPSVQSKSAAYALVQGDNRSVIECTGTWTLTLPDGLSVGTSVLVVNVSTGAITLSAATTLTGTGTILSSQYAAATVYHAGSNVWRAFGDLTT